MENTEEDDGTGQKGIEKSDGRRPMAEEGRKACGDIGKEILLPWKTEVFLLTIRETGYGFNALTHYLSLLLIVN